MTPQELLNANGIYLKSYDLGNHTSICPKCSHTRSRAHQKTECVSVKIDDKGSTWHCHHCGDSGPPKGSGKGNGHDRSFAATYDYNDADGALRFQKVRNPPGSETRFWMRRPNGHDGWINNTKGVNTDLIYRLQEITEAIGLERTILVVEGEKDVESLRRIGIPATCNAHGASEPDKKPKWKIAHSEQLRGADIVVIPDHDPAGYAHCDATCKASLGIAKRVRRLALHAHWPECPKGGDISDWLDAGHTREQLDALIEQAPDYVEDARQEQRHNKISESIVPYTFQQTLKVFTRWLILPDPTPVYAVLGAVAANLLEGDPVWLGIIGPPSSAKTELLNSISKLPYVHRAATVTPAGLLSGTPKKQRAVNAKGGLLNQIGPFGIISLKDFGSILSMRPDAKAEILAALREIYDGSWTRVLGTDGGSSLSWEGKVGLLFAATSVIDSHYSVIGAMGDRFLLSRLAPTEQGQFQRALQHVGTATGQMRHELSDAVLHLFAGRKPEPQPIRQDEIERIDRIISLVVRLRGAVERDRHSREMENILGAEGTARIGLALERLLAGLDTLSVERAKAMAVVETVALDSVPPLRRRAYEHLCKARDLTGTFAELDTPAIAQSLGLPTNTIRRVLEDLAAYKLIERSKGAKADQWRALEL
jgi:hypothetical protein